MLSHHTESCGCLNKDLVAAIHKKHGMYLSPIYGIWQSMVDRVKNKKNHNYHNYGGRGITVCDKWLTFEGFYEDMGDRPEGLTLDRIDNDLGYCKENCHWVTQKEQCNNTRRNRYIMFKGKVQTISQWSEELGISDIVLRGRLFQSKWSIQKSFTTPVIKKNNNGIEFNGKTQPISEWAREVGIKEGTLWFRIKSNWPIEKALKTPVREVKKISC